MRQCPLFAVAIVCVVAAATGQESGSPARGSPARGALKYDDLFPTDRVLEIQIHVDKGDWKKLRAQSRTFQMALNASRKRGTFEKPFSYFEADVTIDGVTFPGVGIRKKGFLGSLSFSRPSLKIKLNHGQPDASIGGLSKLTLNNNQQDSSLASQYLTYSLFHAAGVPAPRLAFARLTVNGKYLGIYSNVESVREQLLKRAFGSADGVLFEGAIVDFFKGWVRGFQHKRGDKVRGQTRIQELIDVLADAEDADLEAELAGLVDLDSFYKFWALEGLLGFWDGYTGNKNNFFCYLHPETNRFHFMPWGADMAFMKFNPERRDRDAPVSVHLSALLPYRLYQLESGRRRYELELRKLLKEQWDVKALHAECRRIEALLEPHLGRVQRRMPDWIDDLRDFIEDRPEDILDEIEGGMPVWTMKPDPPISMPGGDEWGDTIWAAARNDDVVGIKRHLDKGVDVNTKAEYEGTTALSLAAVAGKAKAVQFLLENGASIQTRDKRGNSPLHGAAFMGHIEVVVTLLANGADVNFAGQDGDSPLDAASGAWNDKTASVVGLIGGLVQMEFDLKKVEAARPVVAELLRQHGARSGH